jgi:hypothetical protein
MGIYREVYLDNDTAFGAAVNKLVQYLPIQVHFSVPYGHHQNLAEAHIKIFKKNFMKLLFDPMNPVGKETWYRMLPILCQAINRQIILSLGTTRESLHFNEVPNFYPLAHLNESEEFEELDCFDYHSVDYYKELVKKKMKKLAKKKAKYVPKYRLNQLVMKRNANQDGTHELYPTPFSGPFQIVKIDFRNVDLKDLKTGELAQVYIEHIKPVSLKEMRLCIRQGTLMPKVETRKVTRRFQPLLDDVLSAYNLNEVLTLEDEEEHGNVIQDVNEADVVPEEKDAENMCTVLSLKAHDSLEKLYEKRNTKPIEFVKNNFFSLFK